MDLKFEIKNQRLIRQDSNILVEYSQEYVYADFVFSDDWQGTQKIAIFKHKVDDIPYQIEIIDNKCLIAWEVIKNGGFSISVVGSDENKIIPTQTLDVRVEKGGDLKGVIGRLPTPTLYSKMYNDFELGKDENNNVVLTMITTNNEKQSKRFVLPQDTYITDMTYNGVEFIITLSSGNTIVCPFNIDLSNFYNKNEINTMLESKVNKDYVDSEILKVKNAIPKNTSQLNNDSNFVVDRNYIHTDNNFTNQEKSKLQSLNNYDDTELREQISQINDNIGTQNTRLEAILDGDFE